MSCRQAAGLDVEPQLHHYNPSSYYIFLIKTNFIPSFISGFERCAIPTPANLHALAHPVASHLISELHRLVHQAMRTALINQFRYLGAAVGKLNGCSNTDSRHPQERSGFRHIGHPGHLACAGRVRASNLVIAPEIHNPCNTAITARYLCRRDLENEPAFVRSLANNVFPPRQAALREPVNKCVPLC